MDKEEFQKKYDNSTLISCTEDNIKKVFSICDLMDLTVSKSKQDTVIFIGEVTAKNQLFHVEQFIEDFYKEIEGGKKKETTLFKQRMKDAEIKIRKKYDNSYIRKGTDTGTVLEMLRTFDMSFTVNTTGDIMMMGEEGETYPPIYRARQFVTDVVANMIDVLNPFINKETMIEIEESDNAEHMMNEAEFYITSTFTTPLHKIYDTQRKVYSIGFGDKEKAMLDEEDFHMFLKALYYMYKCNEWIMKDNGNRPKGPVFTKGERIAYTIRDTKGNTHAVTRISERVYESKEHNTLFITDEEGIVTGIYKEK